jgi:hypothetical protein
VEKEGKQMAFAGEIPRAIYEIRVVGELARDWEAWFDGLAVRLTVAAGQVPTTTLVGPVADQAALRGILCKLWDLNLTLISVRRIGLDDRKEEVNG